MKAHQSFLFASLLLAGVYGSTAQTHPVLTNAQFLGDGSFLLLGQGDAGANYRILASADLAVWDTIANQIADASFGDFAFQDRTAPFFGHRFYGVGLGGGDGTFPSLNITSPASNLITQPTVLLAGTASDTSGIREVRVNDVPIVGTTSFSATLPLTPGMNRFLVSAIDLSVNRNRRSQIVQVQYVPLLPTILVQPVSQTNFVTTTATFSVTASGSAPLGYHWRKNGANLTDGARVSGATTASLVISDVGATDVAGYSVLITNTSGAVTSLVATLTVKSPPGWIPITVAGYSENFDSMGATGTNTPAGWYVGTGTGAVSNTNVTVTTGTATAGGNYSFGSAGSSDRALGSLAGSTTQRDTEARFINASGSNLVSFTIDYAGEQWRQGGGATPTNNDLVLQYSVTGSNFTALGAQFNFSTPYDVGPAGALDGNAITNRVTGIGGLYVPAVAITNGGVFYLRWADADSTGNDHGIGIDDVNVTFTFEPAP